MISHKKQAGIALITVLMILAIMVTIATTMTGRMTTSLLRTEGLNYAEKNYWYGQATIELGRMILESDFEDSNVISLDQTWATPNLVFPVDEGTITGNIVDYRSCFNINAISVKGEDNAALLDLTQFKRLLNALEVEDYSVDIIAESTRDWVDSNDTVDESEGAEDRYYEAQKVPHLTANNLMVDISELRSVQGVTGDIYESIKKHLCALPTSEQLINVNTVRQDKGEVLYALFPEELDLSIEDFQNLLDERPISGWSSAEEFLESDLLADKIIPEEVQSQLSVSSDYFELYGSAEFDDRTMVVKSLFNVKDKQATTVRFQFAGIEEMVGNGGVQ